MSSLANKKIIVGVCAGVAAYKACELVRCLQEQGAKVRVMMTAKAQQFITPLMLQALTAQPVVIDQFALTADGKMSHIELARWADAIVIAPLTANTMANLCQGQATDLITTICLATTAPIFLAPAMNQQMWQHPAVQANLQRCLQYGYVNLGVGEGLQACGEVGEGRLLEPMQIAARLEFQLANKFLQGKRVVITAGPTREYLDPVRYLSNQSSGKMGYALARQAALAGAQVILISGPVALTAYEYAKTIYVETASEMQVAVNDVLQDGDIFIACAAVCDYKVENRAMQKMEKQQQQQLNLVANVDILAEIAERNRIFSVGFAAQTHDVMKLAQAKWQRKGCNLLCVNDVGDQSIGFNHDFNALIVLSAQGQKILERQPKATLALQLLHLIKEYVDVEQQKDTA